MATDLTSGIVRILRSEEETAGTGFIVARDLVVTCAHVIPATSRPRDGKAGEYVELVFRVGGKSGRAEVVPDWWRPDDAEDVAFLKLKEPLPDGVRPLSLGLSQGTAGHPFQTFGFPSVSPEEGIRGDGHILGETLMQGKRVLQLKCSEITPGFSGAPVLDSSTDRVVGMVNAIAPQDGYGRLGETAFIIPTETLRLICPLLVLSDVQPYLGLAAFKESDAEFFFGRRREVERLLDGLKREPRFLAVLGPSGSGKSSVVQAGLIPELRRGGLPGSDRWGIITARPGERPRQNLEAAGLAHVESGLVEAIRHWLAENPKKIRLMLILDQFEELFAVASPADAADFLRQLQSLLQSDLPLTLMLIMRDDFFSRLGREAPLALFEWVQRGFVHVSASLEEVEIAEIIEGPAEKVGLQFEEGLVQAMVRYVLAGGERAGRSTVLPLLEFALTKLWEKRDEGYLTHEAYSAIGGVTGSLTQWADQAYQRLAQEGLGNVTRRVLTELVSLGDERQGIPDSRRRRALEDFGGDPSKRDVSQKVVRRLADARLVTTSFDRQSGLDTVEIIHDSLIREWGRLRGWLGEDRSFLAWGQEMERRSQAWEETSPDEAGRDEGRLLRGRELSEAEGWLEKRGKDLGRSGERFIRASVELRERELQEQERRRRRNMRLMVSFSAVLLILFGIAAFEWNQADEKSQLREDVLALYLASQSQQIDAAYGIDYVRQVLLAVESLRRKETAEGYMALSHSMALLTPLLAELDHKDAYVERQEQPIFNPLFIFKEGKNNTVWKVAFSPDGRKVLTGSDDGRARPTVRIWNVSSSKEIQKWIPGDGSIDYVDFNRNGTMVLTGCSNGTAQIWDASSGKKIHELVHGDRVNIVDFSPDGTKVVTTSYNDTSQNYTVDIRDVASGKELCRLPYAFEAFIPNSTKVLTTSNDTSQNYTAHVWDISSGQELLNLSLDSELLWVDFSPDGTKALISCYTSEAWLWDISSGQGVRKLSHKGSVTSVAFSPDGTKAMTGSSDGTAYIWDVSSGKKVSEFAHENGEYDEKMVQAVAFSSDGTKALTGSRDGTARVWDILSGQEIHRMVHDDWVNAAAFSRDGTKAITSSNDGTARIWEVSGGQKVHKLPYGGSSNAVAFSPDGTKVITGSSEAMARIWDAASGQVLHEIPIGGREVYIVDAASGQIHGGLEGRMEAVAFSPDGTKAITGKDEGMARIWNVSRGQMLHELPCGGRVEGSVHVVAFSPDGTKAITASRTYNRTVRIWDVSSGQLLHELPCGGWGWVQAAAFSPDGTKVLTGNYGSEYPTGISEGMARIWDVSSGQLLHELPFGGIVYAVEFSPDGTKALTGSLTESSEGKEGMAQIWDVSSGQLIHNLSHGHLVRAMAFSPDGTKALTGSQDGTARIWDVESGKQIHMLVHKNTVGDVAFSPNGTMVLTGCFDGTARIWNVASGQEVHRIDGLGSVSAVAFNPDGSKVLIGGSAAWIWPVSDQELISEACNCIAENFTQEDWEKYKISDIRTCPREGRFNSSSNLLSSLSNNLTRLVTGSPECEPCVARTMKNGR